MYELASPEWVDAVDGALRAVTRPEGATGDVVVEYRIIEPDGSTSAYHVSAQGGGYRAATGTSTAATAIVTMDRAVALDLVSGARETHEEMLMGTVTVDGDTVALVGARADIATIRSAVASVPVARRG